MTLSKFLIPLIMSINVLAQSSSYVEPSVPTGVPLPGDYTGPLRPQVHFSPPQGFMNDPCGMFLDKDGTYHLYYQYNPSALVAGNQHWGHATSLDLYHWVNEPIALFPFNASSLIYTGSAVIDVNNTSGFFPNQTNGVVAFFTIADIAPIPLQSQGLAYSLDGGYTFTLYSGNPILDLGLANFRDPKVIWYEDHWVMVVSYATQFKLGFYTSYDLKNWTHASNFSSHGLLGYAYECPNLVSVPVQDSTGNPTNTTVWLLQISVNPGAPQGGSATQYFPGSFDGYTFTALDGATRLIDFGKDNYAGQFFYGSPPGQAIAIDWASNWQYCQSVPTGPLENFRSAMSLPRRVALRSVGSDGGADWAFISEPVDLAPVIGASLLSAQNLTNTSTVVDFAAVHSNAIYFSAHISHAPTAGSLNFTFASPISGEYLQFGVFLGAEQPVFVNRGGLRGFDDVFFTDKFSTSTFGGVVQLSGVLDRSLLEVFLNRGERAGTTSFFAQEPLTVFSVATAGLAPANVSVDVAVWALESAWQEYEDSGGIVRGNVSGSGGAGAGNGSGHGRVMYDAGF